MGTTHQYLDFLTLVRTFNSKGNMFWFSSFVALLASIGLVLAMPGGDKHIITSCATQSTCKAVYSTYSKEKDVPVTKVITTTVYKPETETSTKTEYSKTTKVWTKSVGSKCHPTKTECKTMTK